MNSSLKTEIVAMAIRQLSPTSKTHNSSASFDSFFSVLVTGKTVEQAQAEQIVEVIENGVKAVKTLITRRHFNKIVKNI